jgi:putative aldouronate transport system permease protein
LRAAIFREVNDLKAIKTLKKSLLRDKYLLMLAIPGIVYYIVFHYVPMYGILIAFKDFNASLGVLGSKWVGMKWFNQFFSSVYFGRLLRNTFLLSVYNLLWSFPLPIILALMLNEFKQGPFKRTVQTLSYLPHFISTVVIVSMMKTFLLSDGIVNQSLAVFGLPSQNLMGDAKWFRTLYIASGAWQTCGWNSIIYLAALSGINVELYEAAQVDGATRWQQMTHITLPAIMSTVITLMILQIGRLLSIGYEKILLMYSPSIYETADVISTYVYRRGIVDGKFSFGAAVGLFNSVINIFLLISANQISKRVSETSLW